MIVTRLTSLEVVALSRLLQIDPKAMAPFVGDGFLPGDELTRSGFSSLIAREIVKPQYDGFVVRESVADLLVELSNGADLVAVGLSGEPSVVVVLINGPSVRWLVSPLGFDSFEIRTLKVERSISWQAARLVGSMLSDEKFSAAVVTVRLNGTETTRSFDVRPNSLVDRATGKSVAIEDVAA